MADSWLHGEAALSSPAIFSQRASAHVFGMFFFLTHVRTINRASTMSESLPVGNDSELMVNLNCGHVSSSHADLLIAACHSVIGDRLTAQ